MRPKVSLRGIIKALGFIAGVFISVASVPLAGHASSHREAPLITTMPKTDGTDFYMFNSYEAGRTGFVTLIANYQPMQDPQKLLHIRHVQSYGRLIQNVQRMPLLVIQWSP